MDGGSPERMSGGSPDVRGGSPGTSCKQAANSEEKHEFSGRDALVLVCVDDDDVRVGGDGVGGLLPPAAEGPNKDSCCIRASCVRHGAQVGEGLETVL